MRKIIFILSVLFFSNALWGQSQDPIDRLIERYNSFDYTGTVDYANNLLADTQNFSNKDLIKIYLIKGQAHYSLRQLESARLSFTKILDLDNQFKLDPVSVSPKIISFFDEIRREYQTKITINEPEKIITKIDTVFTVDTVFVSPNYKPISGSVVKSILLPGWGHISRGEKTKGWMLSTASLAALGSMVYFIFDTNDKRNTYLNEIENATIQTKYDKYNRSYKIRNTLIATYAALWIYSQLDLLFFSGEGKLPDVRPGNLNSVMQSNSEMKINISIPF